MKKTITTNIVTIRVMLIAILIIYTFIANA
jgi:hypothetical protein